MVPKQYEENELFEIVAYLLPSNKLCCKNPTLYNINACAMHVNI